MYVALKHLHVACVILSIAGFAARFVLSVRGSDWLRRRFVRTTPHVIDTVLLTAALGMLAAADLNPLHQPWLLAKIAGLLAYIVLGMYALKRAQTRAGRWAAFIAAVAVFGYVVATATSKSPTGLFALHP